MIGIKAINDFQAGLLKVSDNSNLSDTFSKATIEIRDIKVSITLDATSSPTLNEFINNEKELNIDARIDKTLSINYCLFVPINNTGVSYQIGNNLVYKPDIFNLFSNSDYIFIDKLYTIDKSRSTANNLFLTAPICNYVTTIFKIHKLTKCVTVLYDIPQTIKELTLNSRLDCCGDDEVLKAVSKAYNYLEALRIQQDCNDCEKQKLILDKLKDTIDLC